MRGVSVTGGPTGIDRDTSNGAMTARWIDGRSSPPSAPHTSENWSAPSVEIAVCVITGRPTAASEPTSRSGWEHVGAEEAAEQGRQQAVLVLGPLRPGRQQVREAHAPGWLTPLDDLAALVAHLLEEHVAARRILADVVEEAR